MVYEQIQRCSIAFSEFDASPQTINAMARMYDTESMEQKGKRIANSVHTLESLLSPYFTDEFVKNDETAYLRNKAFLPRGTFESLTQEEKKDVVQLGSEVPVFGVNPFLGKQTLKRSKGYGYLDPVPDFQQEAIMDIQEYFGQLVRFAKSLPMFAETKNVSDEEDIWNEGEEE